MQVRVEKNGRGGSYEIVAHRNSSARGLIARVGGKKILPSKPQQQPGGLAVAMSPGFGLSRQLKRSG